MPIRGVSYVIQRLIAILQTYLPAEFDAIDAAYADGLPLDDVTAGAYFNYESAAGYIDISPALTFKALSSGAIQMKSTLNSPGVKEKDHRVDVGFHLKGGNDDPGTLTKRCHRSAEAIETVLCIRYPSLPSGGAETVISVQSAGDMTYIESGQEPGQYARSAKIPLIVHTYEALP